MAGGVVLAGALCLFHADLLRDLLADVLAERPARDGVDLDAVTDLDPAVVGVLIGARQLARTHGEGLCVLNAHGPAPVLLERLVVLRLLAGPTLTPAR